MAAVSYVPLWCKSNYSFLEGASHPEELVCRAALLRLPALALTDRHGVYGLVKAHKKVQELESDLKLLCGAQLTLARDRGPNGRLLLLVQDTAGWKNLSLLLTEGARKVGKGESVLTAAQVAHRSSGLIALWGGGESALESECDELWRREGEVLKQAFGERLYAIICRHYVASEKRVEPRSVVRAHRLGIPIAGAREVLYHQPSRRRLQDVLTCIRHGVHLENAGRQLRPNDCYGLLSQAQFHELFRDRPEWVSRTLEIAERCEFHLGQLRYRYPDEPLPEGKSSAQWLRELAYAGAKKRYHRNLPQEVIELLEKELSLIVQLDYVGYFLTMYEIVCYCRDNDILCQGRGSAANSLVCFCLGITEVDPVKLNLLFERFISLERAEPPDIDLDIANQRREEVISWVYRRYGRERAAMVCNVVRYRPRSAVREVGKVLKVEVPVIERLSRLLTNHSPDLEDQALQAAEVPLDSPLYRTLLELVRGILGFPRHLSIHPGGFLLGAEPVCELVPVENATMDARTVIQWDKYDIEDMGLFKVDLLGLGALSQLHRSFKLIRKHRGEELSMASLPVEDRETFAMLGRGESVGVFQVESRAQMAMLPSLKPKCFYDLVIQVAIVRPGPITGGMVNPYLRRRSGEEEIAYPHQSLRPVLERTLGVPLFQEQVMRLAVVAAGYTPGEADQLRRDMASWQQHGRLERHRDRLITRMVEKGMEPEFAERVFEQIKGFGEYGFPESHAASFALITYATSYLKCHYPAEFTCALLNSQPMGFYSPSTLLEEARREGVTIRGFCAEKSDWECTLEPTEEWGHRQLSLFSDQLPPVKGRSGKRYPFAIRLGLKFLKGFREECARKIIERRPFASARDLTVRAELERRSLELLAVGGGLECYGRNRRSELWAVEEHLEAKRHVLLNHLDENSRDFPELPSDLRIVWDYECAGLSPLGHPLEGLRPLLTKTGFPDAQSVNRMPHGRRIRYAALVICRQRPATAKGTTFYTLEDETGFVNVIVWPKVFNEYFALARAAGFLAVEGRVQNARGVVHLVAEKLYRPNLRSPAEVRSRNFH